MAGHKKWAILAERVRAQPGYAERAAEIDRRIDAEIAAYGQVLGAVRKARDVTQIELAHVLGSTQGQVSRIENQTDLHLSTLEKYLRGLGANLEITAVFPDGTRFELTPAQVAGVEETENAGTKILERPQETDAVAVTV